MTTQRLDREQKAVRQHLERFFGRTIHFPLGAEDEMIALAILSSNPCRDEKVGKPRLEGSRFLGNEKWEINFPPPWCPRLGISDFEVSSELVEVLLKKGYIRRTMYKAGHNWYDDHNTYALTAEGNKAWCRWLLESDLFSTKEKKIRWCKDRDEELTYYGGGGGIF